MKTKTIKVCDAIHVDVACEKNDPVDMRAGGPPVLGYDFFVSSDEDMGDLIKFIKNILHENNRPFMGISHSERPDFPVSKLWTRAKIKECIIKKSL